MTGLLLGIAYFAGAALLHSVFRRLRPATNTVAAYLALGGACGAALLVNLALGLHADALTVFSAAALYAFLTELYLFAFTFAFGSVSAAALVSHLGPSWAAEGGAGAQPEFMIRRRLEGMCASGLLVERGGVYCATGKGRSAALAGRALRAFFRHEGGRPAPRPNDGAPGAP
jgi:hypothetical protein